MGVGLNHCLGGRVDRVAYSMGCFGISCRNVKLAGVVTCRVAGKALVCAVMQLGLVWITCVVTEHVVQ